MAKDAELDRLKAIQDTMFNRKQDAYQAQQKAWEERSNARETMNRAYNDKQRAYEIQNSSWQDFQRTRSSLGTRIDNLNSMQERAFQAMTQAFDSASRAHANKDGASARGYADDGHRYKAEAQSYTAERRRLVEEIRLARSHHDATKPAFARAKDNFDLAKPEFNRAKDKHERAQDVFKKAKADFEQATKAFKKRLEVVRAESKSRHEDKRAIANRAGVPYKYLDNVWISRDSNGNINIYFGGVGKPNGPGHGHYVLDSSGNVTYARDTFDPHGSQNFTRNADQENRLTSIAKDVYSNKILRGQSRESQFNDGTVTVKVKSGFHRSTSTPATDVIVIDRNNPNEHLHLILSENDGSVLFSEWRKNHD